MSELTIRVIAAVVDTHQLVLYKEDGSTLCILQGDPRLAPIVDQITPILAVGGIATLNISTSNPYVEYEKKSSGLVSFFQVAKSFLTNLFSQEEPEFVRPQTLGQIPVSAIGDKTTKLQIAVAEIMQHAEPVASLVQETPSTHTIVAKVGDQLVPNIEKLKGQLIHATTTQNTKGLDLFLQRISKVIQERQHSVEDLLTFLEKADLPIADDGSIIIYKILRRDSPEGYVDCHTRKVKQKIGSYVYMDPSLVDPSRSMECSQGLHVARRAYLRSFRGDVVCLAKVHPEDVIAIPHNDPNKMRVAGYHLLFELSDAAFQTLKNNRPFTDTENAQLLLGRAIAGDHPPILERVKIQGELGTNLVITPMVKGGKVLAPVVVQPVQALSDNPDKPAPVLDPNDVAKSVSEAKTASPARKEQAQKLWQAFQNAQGIEGREETAKALMTFKRQVKVSWTVLGLPYNTTETLKAFLD